jgi:hypothetical protein
MILLKSVFIIAIVAVVMIGVMVPNAYAQFSFSVQNIDIVDKEHYKLIKIFVDAKVKNIELEDRYLISATSFTLQNENGKSYHNQESDCKSPLLLFYQITGKTGGEVTIPLCFHVENHYNFFDIYYRSDKNYKIDSISLNEYSKSSTNTFLNLSEKFVDESSKLISESSKITEMLVEQDQKSFKDTSNKKLVCPSNSYFGMDNNENVVCRDLKTNKIVPSISSQTTTQTSNPQKSLSFWDMLSQFFQNLFGGFSSEPIENSINQITKDIPEKINQVVDNQLQQAEKLIPNIPINPIPTAECSSKEGESRVSCLMGVYSDVKPEDWTNSDYDFVVDFFERYCYYDSGLCGLYYDKIQIAYNHLQ